MYLNLLFFVLIEYLLKFITIECLTIGYLVFFFFYKSLGGFGTSHSIKIKSGHGHWA